MNDDGAPTVALRSETPRSRVWIAVVIVYVPVLLMLWPGTSLLQQLPEQTPTHFDFSGVADDWADSSSYWTTITFIALGCAFVASLLRLVVRSDQVRAFAFFLLGFFSGLLVAIWFASAVVTVNAPAPGQESLGAGVLLAVAAGIGWGGVAYLAHGRPRALPETSNAMHEARASGAVPQPVHAEIVSPFFGYLALGLGVVGVGLSILWWREGDTALALVTLIPLATAVLALAAISRVTVSVDERGLRLDPRWGIPIKRIPLDRIAAVRTTDLVPAEWGGWGMRWLPGRTALVTRGGPALVVERTNGTQFAVTVDDPERLADALAGYLATRVGQV